MSTYIPAIIWLISAIICYYIAKRKNIKPTVLWNLTFVILGPIALPIILLVKKIKKCILIAASIRKLILNTN